MGSYREAEEWALAAARTGTTDPQILSELLPRLRTFNRVEEMIRCIEHALPMSRNVDTVADHSSRTAELCTFRNA